MATNTCTPRALAGRRSRLRKGEIGKTSKAKGKLWKEMTR
jgi:hypothetical protein